MSLLKPRWRRIVLPPDGAARNRAGRAHLVHARLARRCRSALPHQRQSQQGQGPQRARIVCFNRLGELRDLTFENPRHRASGLNLIVSAIILWNTAYLDRAARHLRNRGTDVPDTLLAHVAPLGWEHISLIGDYLWSEIDKPRKRFRPLPTTGSAVRP